ncbi:uncharacterized protein B0P05DRAFT_538479 [Gilbertella persicaria]|uniref:uncharacterized protein n=1 Tax=Gilbertella persicaria TaxID=101096 RepID=UPI0022207CB1|nr:uncharacterized protein B0P05DRAFT_538479 [Gilbertella persicaria]KAI8081885.1 hypothetical protein B0P05DRAFT_538479 [Gilbertella persicaria]
MQYSRLVTILHCVRLMALVTAVSIVVGSLVFYSWNSIPLEITDDDQLKTDTWTIQTITDRRLISTLVAAQASIFCPLFVLLTHTETVSLIEMACQFLMPIGLSLSWMFSIMFDVMSTDLVGQSVCLTEDCILFYFSYSLKYVIVVLFAIETSLVLLGFFLSRQHIQLPLDTEK